MFDRVALGKFKSMQPSAARDSAEAKQFFEFMHQKTKIDLAPFGLGDEHIGWQAYGNISSSLRGADVAIIDLMFAFAMATREENGARFSTISAIASSLVQVQTSAGRFDEQLAFLQAFNARYPGNLFAIGSLIKCRMLRGEIEHAESLARHGLGACSSLEMARDFVYWAYALFDHEEILNRLPELRRNYPTLWQNPVVSTALEVLDAVAKHGGAESRKDPSTVYCLNLPGDTGRWRRVEAAFAQLELRLSRIDGVRADHLPTTLRDGFVSSGAQAGQVGVFLAHLKAWETLVARNVGKALIIEDDALPMFKFSLASILEAMPEDADVVFVNLRSNPSWKGSDRDTSPRNVEYIPMASLDPSSYKDTMAIGGDGYLLSARGADKLIAIAKYTKMHFHVDWQMFMACFRTPFPNKIIPAARCARFNDEVARIGHLNGYILKIPIIQELSLDYSPRRLFST